MDKMIVYGFKMINVGQPSEEPVKDETKVLEVVELDENMTLAQIKVLREALQKKHGYCAFIE